MSSATVYSLQFLLTNGVVIVEIDRNNWNFYPGKNRTPAAKTFLKVSCERKGRGQAKSFNKNDYDFYLEPRNIRLVVNKKVVKKTKLQARPEDIIYVDDQQFTILKGLAIQSPSPIIELSNLYIGYKELKEPAVKNVNFSISRGEFVALMGPSGCGKSTLLKEIGGANNRLKGEIRISGRPIGDYFHSELKTKIGYVQQYDNLHPDLTVWQTLFFTARLRSISSYQERINHFIDKLGIQAFRNKRISTLSGGQRKRVAIAVELLDLPDILLMDEPTSPLDPESIDAFLTTMKSLASEHNCAIVMVTHKPDDMKYVDSVIFLDIRGNPVYSNSKANFIPAMKNIILERRGKINTTDELLGIYSFFSKKENCKELASVPQAKKKPSRINASRQTYGFVRQLFWLFIRYVRVKFSSIPDKPTKNGGTEKNLKEGWAKSAFNYFIQPFLLGLLFFAFPNFNITCLFLISLAVIWLSVNNASKEIVEELPIYQRERAYNLKIDTYLLSKILLLTVIALVQIIILLIMVNFKFTGKGNSAHSYIFLYEPVRAGIYLLTLSITGTTLGLLASTLSKKVDIVLMLVPILLIPQIILSGLVSRPDTTPKESLSYLMIGRWGLEGLAHIQDSFAKSEHITLPGGFKTTKYHSVVVEAVNRLPYDSVTANPASAMYVLSSYNNHTRKDNTKAWETFNSLKGNYFILLLHFIIMYWLCRLMLLKNDPIPISPLYNKRMIRLVITVFFIALGLILLVAGFRKSDYRPDWPQPKKEVRPPPEKVVIPDKIKTTKKGNRR